MADEANPARMLRSVVRAVAYLVPLIALIQGAEFVFPTALYLNVVWKVFTFRILVEAMFALWLVLAWLDPRYRPRSSPILWAAVAFTAGLTVAGLLGTRPTLAFWGNYERMEGVIGFWHLFAYFLVLGAVFDRATAWRWFFVTSVGVCLLVCGDAILQFVRAILKSYGLYDGRPFLQEVPTEVMGRSYLRVDARLASPVFLGIYLLFHVFLGAMFVARAETRGGRARWLLVAALFVAVMLATGTRVAWFGAVAGGAVAAVIYAALADDPATRSRVRRGLAIAGALIGLFVVAAVLAPASFQRLPLVNRLFWMEHSFGPRVGLVESAWEGFKVHPLLGRGLEAFEQLSCESWAPVLYSRELPEWWDRPHNVFLYWLTSAGVVGFVSYVALYATSIVHWLRGPTTEPKATRCLMVGALVGYAVFNQAQPDNPTSHVLFFSLLAFAHADHVRREDPGAAPARSPLAIPLAVGALVLAGVAAYSLDVRNWDAAVAVGRANRATLEGRAADTRREFERALAGGPVGQFDVLEQLQMQAIALIRSANVSDDEKLAIAKLAHDRLQSEVSEHPDDVRTRFLFGQLLSEIGRESEAVTQFEAACERAPRKQALRFELASAYLGVRRSTEAVAEARAAIAVRPDSGEAAIQALRVAILAGDRAFEQELLDRKLKVLDGVRHIDQRVIDAYVEARRLADATGLLDPLVDHWRQQLATGKPKRGRGWDRFESRAAVYLLQGEPQRAVALLEELIALDPSYESRGRALVDQIEGR